MYQSTVSDLFSTCFKHSLIQSSSDNQLLYRLTRTFNGNRKKYFLGYEAQTGNTKGTYKYFCKSLSHTNFELHFHQQNSYCKAFIFWKEA